MRYRTDTASLSHEARSLKGYDKMLSQIFSTGLEGINGFIVNVECDARDKMPQFEIIGLPDTAVKESKDRIMSALENSGFYEPEKSLTVNLAPADRKKEGSSFDLAILVAIMRSVGILEAVPELADSCFIGELSLSGELRPVKGALCMCLAAKEAGFKRIFVPDKNAGEASVVPGIDVYGVGSVRILYNHLTGKQILKPTIFDRSIFTEQASVFENDFADVKGQEKVKRALEIAAAGGHNVLMIGPPGSGKSMLANRLPSILPELTFGEAVETTKIYSITGSLPEGVSLLTKRPFRAPHHTMSAPSLVGGGSIPQPGEISLANNGVLFLDELPEFSKNVTDALRQPLENGEVTISRTARNATYPCSFMLVAAMNPCKCGHYGNPMQKCTCKPEDIRRYLSKISGPLLDRIDIQVEVPALRFDELSSINRPRESSETIRKRVCEARDFAAERMRNARTEHPELKMISSNSAMNERHLALFCQLDGEAKKIMQGAFDRLGMSARGYDRILRVARTIADLDKSEYLKSDHIAEAIQMRTLDRKYWQR